MVSHAYKLSGAPLREIRRERQRLDPELTLKSICETTGIPPRTLLALERAEAPPVDPQALARLSRLLAVDPAQLALPGPAPAERAAPRPAGTPAEIGPYLRARREELQMTDGRYSLRQVAARVGMQPSYLSLIETGKRPLSEEQILYLADEYDEDPDELLALAGEIAGDVRGIILRRPRLFAGLIRALAERGDEEIHLAPRVSADPRSAAQTLAEETREILDQGYYRSPRGRRVDLAASLRRAVAATRTHPPDTLPLPGEETPRQETQFEVREETTLQCIQSLVAEGARPVALNFGDAFTPGGNFFQGGRGQEQSLVGASGLLACLQGQPFYQAHLDAAGDPFYSDHVIHAPAVPVFRDARGELLEKPQACAFITAAAVNARAVERVAPDRRDLIGAAMYRRMLQVLACAWVHGHDTLILGAWGSGTFGNSPRLIATLFHEALTTAFAGVFRRVLFPIIDRTAGTPTLSAFARQFGQHTPATPRVPAGWSGRRRSEVTPPPRLDTPARLSTLKEPSEACLAEARARYRALRIEVYQEGTRPAGGDAAAHAANQTRLREQVTGLCAAADLDLYRSPAPEARLRLWHQIWTKNRLAGIRPEIAAAEIADIALWFDDYRGFADPCWNLTNKGHEVVFAGPCVQDFLNRTGPFAGLQTVGNVPKLGKLIGIARAFKKFFEVHDAADALAFLTSGLPEDDIWRIQDRLGHLGYKGDLTILHLMRDLGFPVMKPDLVMTRQFLQLGWLADIHPDLPPELSAEDLRGTGSHGTRYFYVARRMYQPVIVFANRLVGGLDAAALQADIGWVTPNPLREFELFMARAGQAPDPASGIARTVFPT